MIKTILKVVVAMIVVIFVAVWLLSGGIQAIEVASGHYSLPSGNLIEFISGTGPDSIGEQFTLPGTPSSFPSLTVPDQSTSSLSQEEDATVAPTDSSDRAQQLQQLQQLEAQYQETQQQIQQSQQQTNQAPSYNYNY